MYAGPKEAANCWEIVSSERIIGHSGSVWTSSLLSPIDQVTSEEEEKEEIKEPRKMTTKTLESDMGIAEQVMHGLQMYYTPILVYLGVLGNCLSVCVLLSAEMRRSSSSFYLAAISISDTGFLVALFVVWLGLVDVGLFNQQGFCQFFIYLTTLCSFLSVWFVVAFTVERFIAVRYPLRRQSMCTVARAKTVLLSLTILGLVLCSPVLLFSSSRPFSEMRHNATALCHLADEWEDWASIFNVADTLTTFVLPFSVIALLNTQIARAVWRLARVRRAMISSVLRNARPSSSLRSPVAHADSRPRPHPRLHSRPRNWSLSLRSSCTQAASATIDNRHAAIRTTTGNSGSARADTTVPTSSMKSTEASAAVAVASQTKVTKMLLVVSTVFLLFNLPAYAMRVHAFLEDDADPPRTIVVVQHVCNLLFHTNFAINFVLYCVSGQNFRKTAIRILCVWSRQTNTDILRVATATVH